MNPRALILSAAVVAAVGVGSLMIPSPIPPPIDMTPAWKPKPGKIYPRLIQGRTVSNADFTKLMESKAKDRPSK